MSMVEKVARALCAAADDDWGWSAFYIVDAKDTPETGREIYRAMARAAIEAMMEPTDPMLEAGWSTVSKWVVDGRPEEIWPAMVQAALKEQE